MTNSPNTIAVVGAGQAALSAVMALRQSGFGGAIRLIGDEPLLPYQRPPLTKAYMKGELVEDRLYLKNAAWYEDNDVDLVLGTQATAIDAERMRVALEHGGHIDSDAILLATGSRPRRLDIPGVDLEHVFDLRSIADVEHIKPMLVEGRSLVVIGAGYIGLEAAASARQMDLNVTVLEYAPRVLARVTGEFMSEFFQRTHAARGVDVRLQARVTRILGDSGTVTGVELDDGTVLPADIVLVGIGIVPNEELAAGAGIDCRDGIVVDADTRTSHPAIFAAGDCARRPLVHFGRDGRLESVHNAIEQGKIAAAAILGNQRPTEDCPWFWSDQYDLKLQIAGLSYGYDDVVLRGSPDDETFAAFYFEDVRLLAVDAINSPMEFMLSKKLITGGAILDKNVLADTSVPFKELVAAVR